MADSLTTGEKVKVGALAVFAPDFGKSAWGYYQYLKGQKAKDALGERPAYQIPEEIKQNLTQAQQAALIGLPEEQVRQYVENIQRSQGANLAALTERKAGLIGVGNVAQAQTDAYKQLLGMDATARINNQQKLMEQRALMGDQKAIQWQINQMQPYLQKYGEAQGMIGAGLQNINAGSTQSQQTTGDFFKMYFGGKMGGGG